MRIRNLHDAPSLLSCLREEDEPGKYLYRGQTRRSPPHSMALEDGTSACVESLYPSDFRFFKDFTGVTADLPARIIATRKSGRDRRDSFMLHMEQLARDGRADLQWLTDLMNAEALAEAVFQQWVAVHAPLLMDPSGYHTVPYPLRKQAHDLYRNLGMGIGSKRHTALWSLAQHYTLSTALVDLTDDIRVAMWFATNEWDATKPALSAGEGVVYRFERKALEQALVAQSMIGILFAEERQLAPPQPFFLQKIADIPESCALRPSRQAGYSVYGFDQPSLLIFIASQGFVEAFTFGHGSAPDILPIDRAYLVPELDPFTSLIAGWLPPA